MNHRPGRAPKNATARAGGHPVDVVRSDAGPSKSPQTPDNTPRLRGQTTALSSFVPVKPPPPTALELPGYIVEVRTGNAWLTVAGKITHRWSERGVWATPEAAAAAIERAFP